MTHERMTAYGKYRGKVENNLDPLGLGRLQVSCPQVLGSGTFSWAMPCVPYAGPLVGFFMIPPKFANVWVEFEGGDINYPIWSGCFWGTSLETPSKSPFQKVIKTPVATLSLQEVPVPEAKLELGAFEVKLDPTGVTVSAAATSLKVMPQAVEGTVGVSSIKVDPLGVTGASGTTTLVISEIDGVSSESAPASMKVSKTGVEASLGAQSIRLSPMSVSINDGALEVI